MKKINFMVSSSAKSEHFALWQACFGDTHEEIKLFLRAADSSLLAECRDGDELAGMALLVPATVRGKPAYYGYAVCTAEKHRKKGVCRALHEEIFRLCDAEKKGYFLHPADTGLFAMYAGFGMRLCGGCRYAEYAYSGVGLLTDAPKPRHATADDFARDESDVRWCRGLLEYAAEPDENGICLCFPDGALAYGEKRGDALTLSFSQGLCREHLSALCRNTACGTVKMRLNGDDTPYLMGYNLPFENLHIDFTFE